MITKCAFQFGIYTKEKSRPNNYNNLLSWQNPTNDIFPQMNILFVCSRNKWRSLTAETIFKDNPDYEVKSAGTSAVARVKINAKLIAWADLIFVMEKEHRQKLRQNFNQEIQDKDVIVLDILDDYQYMDEELIEDLQTKVSQYI